MDNSSQIDEMDMKTVISGLRCPQFIQKYETDARQVILQTNMDIDNKSIHIPEGINLA